jgi:uncharacterized repeat protein (TIGR04076 family)
MRSGMSDFEVEVVRVCGKCNAGLEVGDKFSLRGVEIIPQGHKRVCQVAFASIFLNVGRLRMHEDSIFVACPDPGTGEGGNVIFNLSKRE